MTEHVAHILAYYEHRIGKMQGSWPLGRTRCLAAARAYRQLLGA